MRCHPPPPSPLPPSPTLDSNSTAAYSSVVLSAVDEELLPPLGLLLKSARLLVGQ